MTLSGTCQKIAAAALLSLSLTGCLEYENALCTADNAVNIPGLEGTKSMSFIGKDGEIKNTTFEIEHLGLGQYGTKQGASTACLFDGRPVLESQSEKGGYTVSFVERLGEKSFSLSAAIVSQSELEAAGIPFEVVSGGSSEESQSLSMMTGQDDDNTISTDRLRIYNTSPEHDEKLRAALQPSGFGLNIRE